MRTRSPRARPPPGVPFAKVWMHSGPLRVRDASGHEEKMSKSLGNFWTIRDALKDTEAAYGEGNGAEVLRFFLLRSQYRSPISFSSALIEEAQKALVRLYGALKGREAAEGEVDWSEKYAAQFKAAMDDDFNTPLAIAAMFELATEINRTGDPVLVRQLKGLGAVLNILQLDPENFLKGRRLRCRRGPHQRPDRGTPRGQEGEELRPRRRNPQVPP